MLKAGFGTPFAEQLEFFRQKLNVPTARWDDIWQEAHDRAFMVAGAMKADLLNDLRQAVDKAISQGRGLEDFRRDFRKIVKAQGWTGWTGEGSKGGEAWRTRVIWETNMTTSYAAGRYQQLTDPEFLKRRPYWRYVHADYVANPRVQHLAWDGLTLPHDHPFWRTHFPPNGWGCQCRITPVNAREYEKSKAAGKAEAPEGWEDAPGIDKGFAYAPGASVGTTFKSLIDDKLIKLDAPIGAAMYEALRPVLATEIEAGFAKWAIGVFESGMTRKSHAIAGAMTPAEFEYFAQNIGKYPATAEIAVEDRLLVGKKADRHHRQGNAPSIDVWKILPRLLADHRQAYYDKVNKNVVYILSVPGGDGSLKLAVEVDFLVDRPKRAINMVRSGFMINPQALNDRTRYDPIE